MSSYRGILRYDEVLRFLPLSADEGIILPPLPPGVALKYLRILESAPGIYAWIDLHDASPIWVEYYNSGFKLHIINIPEVNTQPVSMAPEDIRWLIYDNGLIRLETPAERIEKARHAKIELLMQYARDLVDTVLSVRGVYIGMDMTTALWLDGIRSAYNIHLTNLLAFTTVEEIEAYNILVSWPPFP